MKTLISLLPTGALLVASNGSADSQNKDQTHPLRLNMAPIVIDQPGLYVLTRNWTITAPAAGPLISVVADGVIVDLRGFTIDYAVNEAPPIIDISGMSATIEDGRLLGGAGDVVAPTLIHSTGSLTAVTRMTLSGSSNPLVLEEGGANVVDSSVGARTHSVAVASDSSIERTRISCEFSCLE